MWSHGCSETEPGNFRTLDTITRVLVLNGRVFCEMKLLLIKAEQLSSAIGRLQVILSFDRGRNSFEVCKLSKLSVELIGSEGEDEGERGKVRETGENKGQSEGRERGGVR